MYLDVNICAVCTHTPISNYRIHVCYFLFQLPYLEQIEDIEKTVNKLEDCAYQLDAYSQKLELKFNNITKKK